MTSLLIFIKHRFPWVWRCVERLNGWLFGLRCPDFDNTVAEELKGYVSDAFDFSPVAKEDVEALSSFLNGLPAAGLGHFDPHGFDCDTLGRLLENRAFAMMKVTARSDGAMAGYFFLRCFFIGRAFHGLAVGERFRGRGIGRSMWALSSRICSRCGLRMFATVSKHNAASLTSAGKGTEMTVVGELANDYLLIECKPLKKSEK